MISHCASICAVCLAFTEFTHSLSRLCDCCRSFPLIFPSQTIVSLVSCHYRLSCRVTDGASVDEGCRVRVAAELSEFMMKLDFLLHPVYCSSILHSHVHVTVPSVVSWREFWLILSHVMLHPCFNPHPLSHMTCSSEWIVHSLLLGASALLVACRSHYQSVMKAWPRMTLVMMARMLSWMIPWGLKLIIHDLFLHEHPEQILSLLLARLGSLYSVKFCMSSCFCSS